MIERFRKERGTIAVASSVEVAGNACALSFPLRGDDDRISAWLNIAYSARAPLTVEITIRSLSGAIAVERLMLRCDLLKAITEPTQFVELTVGPASMPGMVALVFEEAGWALPVAAPDRILREFLAATETLVAMNEWAEANALTDALALQDWS